MLCFHLILLMRFDISLLQLDWTDRGHYYRLSTSQSKWPSRAECDSVHSDMGHNVLVWVLICGWTLNLLNWVFTHWKYLGCKLSRSLAQLKTMVDHSSRLWVILRYLGRLDPLTRMAEHSSSEWVTLQCLSRSEPLMRMAEHKSSMWVTLQSPNLWQEWLILGHQFFAVQCRVHSRASHL